MRSSVGENGRTYLHISNYSDINPPIDIEKSPLQALVHALKDDGSFRSCGGKYVDLERSFNATKDFNQDKKKPEFVVSERVTVSINTFLRMHQSMGRVVAQLEEKGVIKKRDQTTN